MDCVHPRMIKGWSKYPGNSRILRHREVSSVHPRMILGWSMYSRNPRILRHREVSYVHPGMILGWSEYPGNPRILKQGGYKLCPSQDDPGMVGVSRESQDTQTQDTET